MIDNEKKDIYCAVRILDVPYYLDRTYEYYIPEELADSAVEGAFVTVPFGRSNRKMGAVITEIKSLCEYEDVKPVSDISASEVLVDGEAAQICRFLCDYTLCTYGEAVKTVVPAFAVSTLSEYYSVTGEEEKVGKLSEKALIFYMHIRAKGTVSKASLKNHFGDEAATLAASLIKLGLLKKDVKLKGATNYKYITKITLNEGTEKLFEKIRSPMQTGIIEILKKTGSITLEELNVRMGKNVSPQITSLQKKGIVTVDKKESYRNPYAASVKREESSPLSESQKVAYEKLSALYDKDEPCAALLHGITGSGKTRVIKEMIDKVTDSGRGVIMLVPEIALTPQTVGYFCSQYGERVSVIHSSLSQGERFDAWRRIKRGEADIVIGTRSAIFAPVKNLGMIVIDEEQEHTYKSDTDPKYLAHDVARFRCGKNSAMMLLSSATPSLLSYHKAVTGAYTLVEMTERYGTAVLPEVVISDMRSEMEGGNISPLGKELANRLYNNFSENNQSIVFLNRRGYNSAVSCRVCGEAILCPSCSVSLTYHTKAPLGEAKDADEYFRIREEKGLLACHYCGYKTRIPKVCPSCKAEHFKFVGCGTQKAEEELSKAVPGAAVLRMDMDTTGTKNSHAEILEKFRKGEADILLGTQMVTKGHDFPLVTLVGVMNADSSLYLDDFRAAEKTFSMITQVVGRAGRGDRPGVAVVQTVNPDSEVIRLAAKQDFRTFYEKEIRLRKALVFPPFCDMAVLTLSGSDEALLSASAMKLAKRTKDLLEKEYKDVETLVFGPFEAPVYKIQNTCRMRLVFKLRLNRRSRTLIKQLLCEFGGAAKNINLTADLNPSSL